MSGRACFLSADQQDGPLHAGLKEARRDPAGALGRRVQGALQARWDFCAALFNESASFIPLDDGGCTQKNVEDLDHLDKKVIDERLTSFFGEYHNVYRILLEKRGIDMPPSGVESSAFDRRALHFARLEVQRNSFSILLPLRKLVRRTLNCFCRERRRFEVVVCLQLACFNKLRT